MSHNERGNFGSKLGVILASAGSAVGLGNIWRFPSEVGSNGGAAFLLVYILCIILLGLPVMVSEFLIGRHSQANIATSYKKLAPGTHWHWVGLMSISAAFLILSYYIVVAGWTLEYTVAAVGNQFSDGTDYKAFFDNFVTNPWKAPLYVFLFMLLTHIIIIRGVTDGIEKFSKVMMPLLLFIIIVLVFCSLSMPGASEGLNFLLKPDFEKINTKVILSAMGQAFYSMSLGMGCLCTYASYFKRDTNLVRTAASVGIIDTIVAVMAGLIIFPAVFSVPGISADAGPSLVFITLPNVFNIAFHSAPILGYIFSIMFYVLLVLAALTSTISLHEVVTAYIHERFNLSRKAGAYIVTLAGTLLGIVCSLSFGVLKEVTIFDMGFFDLFDFVSAKFLMPFGGMLIAIFTGWYLDRQLVKNEVTNNGTLKMRFFKVYIFLLKYFAPIAISAIFINELLK